MADFLRRGIRSTAGTRIAEYRNLAESIAIHLATAMDFRGQGYNVAQSATLFAAMDWQSQIPNSIDRAYALLGITDAIFPESPDAK